jgi:hypothetical protein
MKETVINLKIPSLKKGQQFSFKLPNLRSRQQVLNRMTLDSTNYNWDFRLSSRGNQLTNLSSSLLFYYQNKIPFSDFAVIANHSDLTVQVRAMANQEETLVELRYGHSSGVPQFHAEFPLKNPSDRASLMDQVIKEVKKVELSELFFVFPEHGEISQVCLTDPYWIDTLAPEKLIVESHDAEGHRLFRVSGVIGQGVDTCLDQIGRMQICCYDDCGVEVFPGQVGVIVFGFPL